MPRNKSEKAVPLKRRVLHPNEGWLTMHLVKRGGTWETVIGAMARVRFPDYATARKYFDEHPKEFWWNDNSTVGINDHPNSLQLNSRRAFFLDHPDPHGTQSK